MTAQPVWGMSAAVGSAGRGGPPSLASEEAKGWLSAGWLRSDPGLCLACSEVQVMAPPLCPVSVLLRRL